MMGYYYLFKKILLLTTLFLLGCFTNYVIIIQISSDCYHQETRTNLIRQIRRNDSLDTPNLIKVDGKYKVFSPITKNPLLTEFKGEPAPFNTFLPRYNLHVCLIHKNAGTVLMAVLCYIDKPKKFEEWFIQSKWQVGLWHTPCRQAFIEQGLAENDDVFNMLYVNHFAVIRDPIERFVSAWLWLCGGYRPPEWCFGCKDDIHCFVTENYVNIHQVSRDSSQLSNWDNFFHFFPQTWYCNFDQHLKKYSYFVYNSTDFGNQLHRFLKIVNVPPTVRDTVRKVVTEKSTEHASSESKTKSVLEEIYKNKTMLMILYNTYYIDYITLGENFNNIVL